MTYTVPLTSEALRRRAHRLVDAAPDGHVMAIRAPTRTNAQNRRFWAMMTDIADSKPQGREHTPEAWRDLLMHAMGHTSRFEMGLNGEPFPVGFRTSQLSVAQMSDLMAFAEAWGTQHGVRWTEVV